jgi:hypothetical protein
MRVSLRTSSMAMGAPLAITNSADGLPSIGMSMPIAPGRSAGRNCATTFKLRRSGSIKAMPTCGMSKNSARSVQTLWSASYNCNVAAWLMMRFSRRVWRSWRDSTCSSVRCWSNSTWSWRTSWAFSIATAAWFANTSRWVRSACVN